MKRNEGLYPGTEQIVKNGLNMISAQYPAAAGVESKKSTPHHRGMSDLSRDELKASTAASEAKVAATLEIIRRENSEARSEMKAALSSFQAENAQFREQMRGFIASAQVENAQFREQVREGVSAIRMEISNNSRDVEGKISGLKIWVLGGALSGALAILLLFARENLANRAHQAPPTPTPIERIVVPVPTPQQAQPASSATPPPAEPAKQR